MDKVQDTSEPTRHRIWRVVADAIRAAIESGLELPRQVYVGPDGLCAPLTLLTLDRPGPVIAWALHLGIADPVLQVAVRADQAGIIWRTSTVEQRHPWIKVECKERLEERLDDVAAAVATRESEPSPYPIPRTTPGPGQWAPIEPDPIAVPLAPEPATRSLLSGNHNGVHRTTLTLHSGALPSPGWCPSCGEDRPCGCKPARPVVSAREG